MRNKEKIQKLSVIGMLCIITILLTGIGFASAGESIGSDEKVSLSFSTDKKVYEQGSNIKLTVKNTGTSPIYVLDNVIVVKIGSSDAVAESTAVLKILPGKSYSWNRGSSSLLGSYKGLIFWGTSKNSLKSLYSGPFEVKPGKVSFYSDKSAYKYKEKVKLTFKNGGTKTVYIPGKKEWKIRDKSGNVVKTLYGSCGSGYGYGCGWTAVYPKGSVSMYWDQKGSYGYVVSGYYTADATYKNSGSSTIQKISTNKFMIKKP